MFGILSLAGAALAYNATTTEQKTYTTTYCPEPTVFTYGNNTFTVTEATTLTIEDCGCTDIHSSAPYDVKTQYDEEVVTVTSCEDNKCTEIPKTTSPTAEAAVSSSASKNTTAPVNSAPVVNGAQNTTAPQISNNGAGLKVGVAAGAAAVAAYLL